MRRRYIYHDGVAHEVTADYQQEIGSGLIIITDFDQPYQSQIDGTMITSRAKHRAHLRDHGCVEIGNDSSLSAPYKPIESPPGLKEEIARQVYQKLRY